MGALVSLLVTIALSLLITHIASMALTMTGLSRDLAKFSGQVCLYRSGLHHQRSRKSRSPTPVRRRILMLLMLLGNAGIVTSISSLVLTFVGTTGPYRAADALWLHCPGLRLDLGVIEQPMA